MPFWNASDKAIFNCTGDGITFCVKIIDSDYDLGRFKSRCRIYEYTLNSIERERSYAAQEAPQKGIQENEAKEDI